MIPASFTNVARVEVRYHRIRCRVVVSAVSGRSNRGGGVKARRIAGQTDSFAERARPVEESLWACGSVADGVLDRAMRAGKLQPSSSRHHRRCHCYTILQLLLVLCLSLLLAFAVCSFLRCDCACPLPLSLLFSLRLGLCRQQHHLRPECISLQQPPEKKASSNNRILAVIFVIFFDTLSWQPYARVLLTCVPEEAISPPQSFSRQRTLTLTLSILIDRMQHLCQSQSHRAIYAGHVRC